MRASRRAHDGVVTKVFFALVFVVFTFVFPYIGAVNNPNENVRTYVTMALVHEHTFAIDAMVARFGWVNDMVVVDEPNGEKHHFTGKAPAISYAGVPVYWLFTKLAPAFGYPVPGPESTYDARISWLRATTCVLRLFVVQLPCFAFLVAFERWLRTTSSDRVLRLTAVAACGLGTNYLGYSLMYVSHAPFAAAAFTSFALINAERARGTARPSRLLWAGFFAGLATLLEYHGLPVSVVLALYAFVTFFRPKALLAFTAGALIDVAGLMLFQWRAFHNPFMPGHRLTESPGLSPDMQKGFFTIGLPDPRVLFHLAFDAGYGFFGTSPFMALGLLALPAAFFFGFGPPAAQKRLRSATLAWSLMMLALFVAISASAIWRGGWTLGPRYLGAAPPFFAFGALVSLEAFAGRSPVRRAVARGVAGGLALASIASIGFVGLQYNTLPESVTRPLVQIAWPLARAGFVPHHAGELLGLRGPYVWYAVAACLFGAALVAALPSGLLAGLPPRERWVTGATQVGCLGLALSVGMLPALSTPAPDEAFDLGAQERHDLSVIWEPPGRDRITLLRDEATRDAKSGKPNPCLYHRMAVLERLVGNTGQADRDDDKVKQAGVSCPRSL